MKFTVPTLRNAAMVTVASLTMFSSGASAGVVRLGISEFADYSVNQPILPATVEALEQSLGKENLRVQVYPVARLQEAVRDGEFDIIISSAGTYRRMAIEGTGVKDLATVATARAPNPNYADGSIFFTLRERKDIEKLSDMKGKTVAAMHQYAFSGWQTAMREIQKNGYNPDTFFGDINFFGHEASLIIDSVVAGNSDVGIVRACFLEDLRLDTSKFKIIGEKTGDNRISCAHSTDLYANWTVSTLPSTKPEISRRIGAVLLAMPAIENNVHWSIATDFREIDTLFKSLRIGPYEYLQHLSFSRLFAEYWPFLSIFFVFVMGLILHSVTVGFLVRRRTHDLEVSLQHEKELEKETKLVLDRFNQMQRVGIVGQMSSIIAHELRQPLASISMFCYGVLRRFENNQDTRESTMKAIEKISDQTARAVEIVDQVRSYAKGARVRTAQNLTKLAESAIADIQKTERAKRAEVRLLATSAIWVEANALEIELVFINLIKNAIDAVAKDTRPKVEIVLIAEEKSTEIVVRDNGPALTDERWESIVNQSQSTTKATGLGLGLSIVRSIAEDLGGRVFFERSVSGSLVVRVKLNRIEIPEDPNHE